MIAANLRPAIAVTGPLIGEIQDDLNLSSTGAGVLGSLPVLCFGLFSVIAPKVGRRFGLEEVLAVAMIVLATGTLLRVIPSAPVLLLGTALFGTAIAFSNVLLPALVKRTYPSASKRMSGVYVAVIITTTAVAAGLAIPLSKTSLGWEGTLAIWAVPAMLTALFWLKSLRHRAPSKQPTPKTLGVRELLQSKLAWAVIGYLAAQSFGFYIILTWLTEILIDSGISLIHAGLLFSATQLVGIVPIFTLSLAGDSITDDRIPVAAACLTGIAGLAAMLVFGSGGALAWTVLIGIGQGAGFALGLSFLISRSATPSISAELSGVGQSVAYLVAATEVGS